MVNNAPQNIHFAVHNGHIFQTSGDFIPFTIYIVHIYILLRELEHNAPCEIVTSH